MNELDKGEQKPEMDELEIKGDKGAGGKDYVAQSEELVSRNVPMAAANALYLLFLIIIVGFIWAAFASVDTVTVAQGKVIASSELQEVQNLEGGIVKEILIHEGEKVKKGQLLVKLDDTRFLSDHKQGLAKSAVLDAEMIRLKAESEGKNEIHFPEAFEKANPDLVEYTKQLFERNTTALNKSLAVMRKSRDLMKKELNIVAPLAKQGVMSDVEQIRLERQLNALNGQILDKIQTAQSEARDKLNNVKDEYTILVEKLIETKDRLARTNIYSPVNGIVNQVYVSTIGEVVKPGDNIVEIVPIGEKLIIQAYVLPSDIGFIHPGEKATVKVSAFDFSIYGGLDAVVDNISADSITDKEGRSFYEVKLTADKTNLGTKEKPLMIMPGMTVTANIITGNKTILEYILKPFYKARYGALHER